MQQIIEFILAGMNELFLLALVTTLLSMLFLVPRMKWKAYLLRLIKVAGIAWMVGMVIGTLITIIVSPSAQSGLVGFLVIGPMIALLAIVVESVRFGWQLRNEISKT